MTTLSPAQERARLAFDLIANIRGLTNVEIGKRTGLGTTKTHARRKGISAITLTDVDALAPALEVPMWLLNAEPAQIFEWFRGEATGDVGKIVRGSFARQQHQLVDAA